ncbi:MAG: HAMP domain-containing histidine kinase [Lachnospiraceae bacterium]|nr:HAMP domain-containing histidine kinase [Lachnospiraceae bacterium]
MEKSIRKKFVIVTTIMMTALIAILWIGNYIYQDFWYERDMLRLAGILLEGEAFDDQTPINSDLIFDEIIEDEPIIYVVADEDRNIISKQIIGTNDAKIYIPDKVIYKMLNADSDRYKINGYVFSCRSNSDGTISLVALKPGMYDGTLRKIIGRIILISGGIVLIILISFILSRFVTLPAREALEREKRFISDASHELKTPLGAISINAEALDISGKDSVYVKNILSETARMNRLIENLLTLSKLEESKLDEKKAFSLSDVVQEMCLTYESVAFEKGREFSFDIEEKIILYGNSDEIRQLIAILLDNAIKNSESGGKLSLECYKGASGTKIKVSNTGPGIKEDDLEHIFDRFYTTDQSRNSGSFGLGLSIAKEIVSRHDGTINVASVPDEKTVFTIIF